MTEKTTAKIDARRQYSGPAWLERGYRPFFLASGVWALIALPLWLLAFTGAIPISDAIDPALWHAHELLFGYGSAALIGFLLTAIPNWTGRLPVRGTPLGALFALWAIGRLAMTGALLGILPTMAAIITAGALLPCFILLLLREILAGKNWRNLPVAIIATALAATSLWLLTEMAGLTEAARMPERTAIALFVLLIGLIGGRIIPSFTTNWLRKRGSEQLPTPPMLRLDIETLILSGLTGVYWVLIPDALETGLLALVATLSSLLRVARWRGHTTFAEPLVLILNLAYLWIPIGFGLLAAHALLGWGSESAVIHAWTAGGIASMTLAVMTRASLGHSGRAIEADGWTTAIFAAILVSGVLRVTVSLDPTFPTWGLHVAGLLWIGAFAIFTIRYASILVCARK